VAFAHLYAALYVLTDRRACEPVFVSTVPPILGIIRLETDRRTTARSLAPRRHSQASDSPIQ
jgi:hypothetical protein